MTKEELYKEAEEWTISHVCKDCSRYEECKSKERCTCKECSKEKWQNGAWFGYNKFREELNQTGLVLQSDMDETIEQNILLKNELNNVKEWHYVKDGDLPKEKGNYLVAWKRICHVEEYGEWGFDVDLFNADEGYFEGAGDFVIAWKEIVLPKEIKEK